MSKPLKLMIHPRLEDTNLSAHDIHQGRLTTLRLAQAKRLTDAEMAAAYWANESAAWRDYALYRMSDGTRVLEDQSIVLLRFAKTPHYFEVDQ